MDPSGGARFHAARIEKKRFNLELYLHELLLIPEVRVSNELKTFLGVTPVPLGLHTINHNKNSRSNNIIQHEVKNNINNTNNNLKSFIDITNNNHTNVNETKANVINDSNISENNEESSETLQTIENENQHGFGGDDDDNEGDINVISNNTTCKIKSI